MGSVSPAPGIAKGCSFFVAVFLKAKKEVEIPAVPPRSGDFAEFPASAGRFSL
jgi:hypothetical protein